MSAADGVHLVVMVRRMSPVQRAFADVSNEVWREVTEEAKRKVRRNNLKYLRSKADIQVAGP